VEVGVGVGFEVEKLAGAKREAAVNVKAEV
jgi:hypothetical protein